MYLFQTNGGCAICDAMEGLYDEEPARPHRYCDCTISLVDDLGTLAGDDEETLTSPTSGRPGGFDRTGPSWNFEQEGPIQIEDEDGDNYGETYVFGGILTVDCCDGKTFTAEDFELRVSVDLRAGSTRQEQDALLEEAFLEAEVAATYRAQELMGSDCETCDQIVS